jgi:hypothetical protein
LGYVRENGRRGLLYAVLPVVQKGLTLENGK